MELFARKSLVLNGKNKSVQKPAKISAMTVQCRGRKALPEATKKTSFKHTGFRKKNLESTVKTSTLVSQVDK